MNSIQLIGRLGDNPIYTPATAENPTSSCFFKLAVDEKKSDGSKRTDWFACTAMGKTADAVVRYCAKGKQVAVMGKVHCQSSKVILQNGQEAWTNDFRVRCRNVEFLADAGAGKGQAQAANPIAPQPMPQGVAPAPLPQQAPAPLPQQQLPAPAPQAPVQDPLQQALLAELASNGGDMAAAIAAVAAQGAVQAAQAPVQEQGQVFTGPPPNTAAGTVGSAPAQAPAVQDIPF
jgi:single-strand DNA-binding protein